jgi:queuosine precursor transporter
VRIVALYLGAVVAANLTVAAFGPAMSIVNAFLFIGLDLTSRDKLHDAWSGRHLWLRMALLVAAGGALSWVINRDAAQIAVASTVSFVLAGAVDAIAYHLLRRSRRMVRVNGSNTIAAAVDSLVFPTLAFGGFMPLIVLGQFAAKVAGGFVWSLVLGRR